MAAFAQEAQQKTPPAKAKEEKPIATVEVKAAADTYDPRRDDTASKTVISNEEIMKYGDTNVFDVLKRAPGVTVIGNAIRMRGLGNGYTQVLVNGERPPPGFSLDNVAPEQIEKIEVIRAASAEYSMQAVAGTVNIVLKKVVAKTQRDLRINTTASNEQKNLFVAGTFADRSGNVSWFVNPVLGRNLRETPGTGTETFTNAAGQVTQWRDWTSVQTNSNTFVGLQPRVNWKLPGDDQLNISGFMQHNQGRSGYTNRYENRIGRFSDPDYVDKGNHGDFKGGFAGMEVNWIAKLWGGKLDAKLWAGYGSFDNRYDNYSSTADHAVTLDRYADSSSDFRRYSTTGKYARTLFEGHSLATGWELSRQSTEDDILRIEGFRGQTPVRIPEHFKPVVTRAAVYGQDEWNVTKNWSMYLGARWEGIRTESSGTGLADTESNTHVLSPVAQTLYKFPDKSGRQLRAALTRTYKAPDGNQLTARRYYADDNTRFAPDSSGNPDLRPELATGIDLTYEHFFAPGAVFSVGTSQRRIRDYIRTLLRQDANGYWLVQPVNDGNATVRTFDVDLKFPLKAVLKDGPPLDLRASFNRNWSKVRTVPGPDNRLDEQIPLTVNLGVDYKGPQHSAGASFAYRGGGPVRMSEEQFRQQHRHRDLDMYWLYKFTPQYQVRITLANLLADDSFNDSRYVDARGTSSTWSRSDDSRRVQANLEMKF